MKVFWTMLLLIFITLGVWRIGFEISQPYGAFQKKVVRAIESGNTIKAITLGNSHGGSIDWENLGFQDSGYYLHGGFFDVFEMHYVAESVLLKMDSLRYVFIPIPYYFFQFDNGAMDDNYQNSFRQRTYFATPKLQLINGDWRNFISAHTAPIVRPDHWKGVIAPFFLSWFEPYITFRPIVEVPATELKLETHSTGRTQQHVRQTSEMMENHPNLFEDSRATFQEILALLKENGVTPVLFTPPYHTYYNQKFDPEMRENTLSAVQKIADDNGIFYFNFNSDSSLVIADSLYTDSDHLNPEGAKAFSAHFKSRLFRNE